MANKAQTELQGLLDMQAQSETRAANMRKLQGTGSEFAADTDGEADFATPEALALGVGAAWLLGPAGLLVGAAAGIMGKREEQRALDAFAAETQILNESNQVINNEFDMAELAAGDNLEERMQVSAYRAMFDKGSKMQMTPYSKDAGAALIGEAITGLTQIQITNEEQRIDAETREAQRTRDLDKDQASAHRSLLSAYDAQSANYEETVKQSQAARQAIISGDPISLNAALIMVNKALDPTSVVRPEEAKALGNVGTLIDQASTKIGEWIETGAPISETQQKELYGLIDTIENTARSFQIKRDMRFQERAIDQRLPERYVNDFRRVTDLPAFVPEPFKAQEKQIDTGAARDTVTNPVTNAMEAVAPVDGSASVTERLRDWYSGSGREERARRRRPTN